MLRIGKFFPLILALLLLSGSVLFVFFLIPNATRLIYDPRLEEASVAMGGECRQTGRKINLLSGLISPPQLYLGLDMPPKDFNRAALHQNYFQVVSPPQSRLPKIDPLDRKSLKFLSSKGIFTNDPFIYAKFKEVLPKLELLGDVKKLKSILSKNSDSAAILRLGQAGLPFKPLSAPFPFYYWVGWKENDSLAWTGINAELLTIAENLISHSQLEYKTRFNTILLAPVIKVGEGGLPDLIPLKNWTKGGNLVIGGLGGEASGITAEELLEAGFTLINLANEKSMANGPRGLENTLLNLKNAGLGTIGGGFNHEEAARPYIFSFQDGTKIGVLAYSAVMPAGSLAAFNKAGINSFTLNKLENDLRKLKMVADIRVVLYYWASPLSPSSHLQEKAIAHQAIDNGCDLFIGNLQEGFAEGEWYKGKLNVPSLGSVKKGIAIKVSYNFSKLFQIELNSFPDLLEGPNIATRVLPGKN